MTSNRTGRSLTAGIAAQELGRRMAGYQKRRGQTAATEPAQIEAPPATPGQATP